jgi:hypothetical protein
LIVLNLLRQATSVLTFSTLLFIHAAGPAAAADTSGYDAISTAEKLCLQLPAYDLEKISAAVDEIAGRHVKPEVGPDTTRWTRFGPEGRKLVLLRDSRPGRLKCAFQAERVDFNAAEKWLDYVSAGFAASVNGERQEIVRKSDPGKGSGAITTVKTELGQMFFGIWSTPDGGAVTSMGPLKEFMANR